MRKVLMVAALVAVAACGEKEADVDDVVDSAAMMAPPNADSMRVADSIRVADSMRVADSIRMADSMSMQH